MVHEDVGDAAAADNDDVYDDDVQGGEKGGRRVKRREEKMEKEKESWRHVATFDASKRSTCCVCKTTKAVANRKSSL